MEGEENMGKRGEGREEAKGEICIYIPRDIYEELERLAEELNMPIGAVLRKLLERA